MAMRELEFTPNMCEEVESRRDKSLILLLKRLNTQVFRGGRRYMKGKRYVEE